MDREKKKTKPSVPLRPLGWLLGGLSILNLAQDLSPILLYGKLKLWVQAYYSFIETLRTYFFGWINFRWLSISEMEAHVLIIAGIIFAAYSRAHIRYHKTNPNDSIDIWFVGPMFGLWWFLMVFLFAIALPSWWGLAGSITILLIIAGYVLFAKREGDFPIEEPPAKIVQRELIGAFVAFLLLLAFNYSVFRG